MSSLSEMPDDIVYHISASLTNREVAHFGTLSKNYYHLMRKRPILGFDFKQTSNLQHRREIMCLHSSLVRYHEQNLDLEKFSFRAQKVFQPRDMNIYNSCIFLALHKGVRDVEISMWEGYALHVPAVMESLEILSVKHCLVEVIGPVISWPNLKRLNLVHAFVRNGQVFENIIRGCPLLEDLELDFIDEANRVKSLEFRVINLLNLKKVKARLGHNQSLVVAGAPNLESFVLRFNFTLDSWLDVARHRLDWMIRQPMQYSKLTRLSLCYVRIREEFFLYLGHMFPKLEHLSVKCFSLGKFKISSRTVKTIHLSFIWDLQEAQLDVPSITLLKFRFRYRKDMPILSFTSPTLRRWKSDIRIRVRGDDRINEFWFEELKHCILLPLKGSQIILSLDFKTEVFFHSLNLTQYSSSPFHAIYPEIEEVYIHSVPKDKPHSSSSFQAVLENIFWICRPKTLLFRNWYAYNFEHPRLLHEYLFPASRTYYGWSYLQNAPSHCVWRVTSVKLFRHAMATSMYDYYIKRGRGYELLPRGSNCEAYLQMLRANVRNGRFISGFKLRWMVCG